MRLDPLIIRQRIDAIKREHPELFADGEAWLLTLDSETDLNELLDDLTRGIQEDAAFAAGLAIAIDDMKARRDRFEARENARRKLVLDLLKAAGIDKAQRPRATISVRDGATSVVVTDETAVPDQFCKIIRAPNKTRIKKFLQSNKSVNWATLTQGERTLSIRFK